MRFLKYLLVSRWLWLSAALLAVWGSVPLLVRLSTNGSGPGKSLSGIDLVFWVNVFALPTLAGLIHLSGRRSDRRTTGGGPGNGWGAVLAYAGDPSMLLTITAIGLLGNFVYQFSYFVGIELIAAPALFVVLSTGLSTLATVRGGFGVDRVPFTRAHWIAVLLGIAGMSLAYGGSGYQFDLGGPAAVALGLAVVAAIANSAYSVAIRANLPDRRYDAASYVFIFKCGTVILAAILYIGGHQGFPVPPLKSLAVPALIGLFADGIGFVLYAKIQSLKGPASEDFARANTALLGGVLVQTAFLAAGQTFGLIESSATGLLMLPAAVLLGCAQLVLNRAGKRAENQS